MLHILILNLILYSYFGYWIYKKDKLTIASFLSIFYIGISLLGLIVWENGIYQNAYKIFQNGYSLYPYVMMFICIVILILPLRKVKYENMNIKGIKYTKTTKLIVNIWLIDTLIFIIMKISQAIIAFNIGLDETYDLASDSGGLNEIIYGKDSFLMKFNNLNINLMYSFTPFLFLYAFNGLIHKQIKANIAYVIITFIFIAKIANSISLGSRGNLFFSFFSFLFYVILFYQWLPQSHKKKIRNIGITAFFIILTFSFIASQQRLDRSRYSNETPITTVARYFGEPFPNLDNLFWKKVLNHPSGRRLFPDFYYSINSGTSRTNKMTTQEAYTYWESITGVPVRNYKTLYGDLYIEFGEFFPILIVIFLASTFYIIIGRKKIDMWKFALIFWYYDLVLQGIFGFNKSGHSELIVLTAVIIVSLVIKVYANLNKTR